jgi:hypothetical protein
VAFTSFSVKLEVPRNTKNLVGSKIKVHEDFSLETRKIWKGFIPYLKDTKKRGLGAFLKDTLVVNGRTYDLDYVVKNIQLGEEGGALDIPVRKERGKIGGN